MPVIDVKKIKIEKNQRDTSRKTNFIFRSEPLHLIRRSDGACASNDFSQNQLQYSAKIGSRKKKKRHVEITTAMGQENVFVSTCPLEIAGKVESKHVVILPKLQNQK